MYTREQAEQVLKDWMESSCFSPEVVTSYNQFLDAKFPKLKNGMWVKCVDRAIVYITDVTNGSGYGFNRSFSWEEETDSWTFDKYTEDWRPATDKEVIEALEKYANFIGLVEGARVKCLATGCIERVNIGHFTSGYDLRVGNFYLRAGVGAILVMKNGEWATPIKSDLHEKLEELKKQAEAEGMKLVITFENK